MLERANAHLGEELYRQRSGTPAAASAQRREAHWSDPRPPPAADGVSAARWPQQWHRSGPRAGNRAGEANNKTPPATAARPAAPEPGVAQPQPASDSGPEMSSETHQRASRSPSPRPDSEHAERSAQATTKHRAAVAAAAADAAALDAARATCSAELRACGAVDAAHRGDVASLLAAVGAAPPLSVADISSCQRALRSATARYHPDRVSGADVAARARSLEICQLLQACRAVIEGMHDQMQQAQQGQQQQTQQPPPPPPQQNDQQAPPPQPQPPPQPTPPAPSASDAYYESAQAAAMAAEERLRAMMAEQQGTSTGATPGDSSAPRRPVMRAKRPTAAAPRGPGAPPGGAPTGAQASQRRVFTAVRPMNVDA